MVVRRRRKIRKRLVPDAREDERALLPGADERALPAGEDKRALAGEAKQEQSISSKLSGIAALSGSRMRSSWVDTVD